MGRIKTQLVKRVTHELLEMHPKEFSDDFEKNKLLVEKWATVTSKKIRNIIAGYITRLVRKENVEDLT